MELSIKNREALISILVDTEGTKIEVLIIDGLIKTLRLTEEECKQIDLVQDELTGGVTWNAQKAFDRGYDFTPEQAAMLKKAMCDLSARGKFRTAYLPLDSMISAL